MCGIVFPNIALTINAKTENNRVRDRSLNLALFFIALTIIRTNALRYIIRLGIPHTCANCKYSLCGRRSTFPVPIIGLSLISANASSHNDHLFVPAVAASALVGADATTKNSLIRLTT